MYTVLADIATSLMTAIVTSAWTLGPYFRSGADADVAMLEVLVARLADQLLAAHFGDNSDVTWSTREPNAVPNDIYAALGGPVAVTVRDDHAWGVLSEAVGLREPRWNTLQARTSDAAALRAALTDHIGRLNRDELVARLQAGGVPAAPVLHPVDSYTDETLRERGLFRKLKHEERGSYWTLCQPWRIVGGDDRTWTAAPVLGSWNKAHNVAIPSLPDQP